MRRRLIPKHLFLLLLSLLLALPALAVELTGQIRGTVTDNDGLAVPGVVVNLTSPQMQGGQSAETGPDGEYRFIGLPPGDYTVEAVKAGFNTVKVTAKVASGLTARADLTMVVAVAGEEIIVDGEAPVVDTSSVRQGTVVTKEMMRDIPNAGRDYQTATTFSPGVVDNGTGNNNIRGGLAYSNQYYVDGVNTTDPLTNTFSMNMNFDAIEEVQVITGGMDAEYGRSMGGAVNVVTRSGGNEYEGDVQYLYNATELQIYKPDQDDLDSYDENGNGKLDSDELPENQEHQIAINLGGPVMKDELWFFASVQGNLSTSTLPVSADVNRPEKMQSETWKSGYLFGKLTWKPTANHRVWLHAQTDPTDITNADRNIYTLPSAEIWWQQGGWLASLGDQWTPDTKTIVDTQLFTSRNYLQFRPMQWKDECTGYDDLGWCENAQEIVDQYEYGQWQAYDPDGFNYGPFPYAYYTKRNRSSANVAVTRFFHALGSHQAKAGFQAELMDSYTVQPGVEDGIPYYSHQGDPAALDEYEPALLIKYDNNQEVEYKGSILSWYLQDAWTISRVTLRPGLRFDLSRFLNNKDEVIFKSLTVAPRFGVAYDLTGDGRTRAHAYYGRFFDSGFLELSDLLSKDVGGYGYYGWDDNTGAWSTTPSQSVASGFEVHDDLKNPYSDEIDLGVTRDVGDGWALGVNFTYEKSHNLWEDDEVNGIFDDSGSELIGTRDGTGELRYRLRSPDEAFIEYTAVEVSANRQFDEHWGMISSYTWSRAYGRSRNDLSQGLASAAFDFAPQHQYEVGLMPYDTPHSVKVAGSYRDPYAWELGDDVALGFLWGWNFELTSGTPYRPKTFNATYSDWYNSTGPIDGSYRLPAYSRTDLKAGLTVAAAGTTWDITAECFNVFNSRETTSVQTAALDANGQPLTDEDGNVLFGQPTSRQSPRYFQLGLRGEF